MASKRIFRHCNTKKKTWLMSAHLVPLGKTCIKSMKTIEYNSLVSVITQKGLVTWLLAMAKRFFW